MDISYSQVLTLISPLSMSIGDTTIVFSADRVSDAGSGTSATTSRDIVVNYIRHVRTFANKFNEFQEIDTGLNLLSKIKSEVELVGTDLVLKVELKGDAGDTQIDFTWTYDTLADTIVVQRASYDVTLAAFVANLDLVERFLAFCKQFA